MTDTPDLPRVTYSNIAADFGPLHDWLDEAIPAFRSGLGRHWPNVVAGKPDSGGETYAAVSPIDTSLVIGELVAADAAAVARAVAAAKAAFPGWSQTPWPQRVEAVRRLARELEKRKYDIGMAALFEVGKSRLEAIGEAEEAVDLVDFYCDEMERNQGYQRQMARAVPEEETVCTLRPVGVFAVIAPFNFPAALVCNMLGACLVAGNTAVFKPSPGAGLSGAMIMQAMAAAGLPEGVVNMVSGDAAGPLLVDAEGIDGFAFTGSHQVGMEIFRKAANGPFGRPTILEMGGKNPTYVTATADLNTAAEGLIRSAFGLQGQKCSACSVAYVDAAVHDRLLDLLAAKTADVVVVSPESRDCFMGPVIDAAAVVRFERASETARQDGRVVCGGRRLTEGAFAKGHFVEPTVVAGLPEDHWLNLDEQFIPFLSVQSFDSLEAAIERGNRVLYGLTAGIYTDAQAELDLFLGRAAAGVLYANRRSGATTGAWPGFQTFCGWKGSGVDGKGGLGPYQVPRFMREQSHTIMHKG